MNTYTSQASPSTHRCLFSRSRSLLALHRAAATNRKSNTSYTRCEPKIGLREEETIFSLICCLYARLILLRSLLVLVVYIIIFSADKIKWTEALDHLIADLSKENAIREAQKLRIQVNDGHLF